MYCELQRHEINLIIKFSIKFTCLLIQKVITLPNSVGVKSSLLIICIYISDNGLFFRKHMDLRFIFIISLAIKTLWKL